MLTVILPVWNSEQQIERSVRSVLAQTFKGFEMLVVNDGSTDATGTVLEQLALSDNRIRIISKKHSGVADAFNLGLREAKGKYIARMDADDEMHPERLEKQMKFLDEHPEIGVVSCLVQHGGDAKLQEGYATHIHWINTLMTPEEIALNRFVESPVCNPSVIFRSELVALHGVAFNGNFPEDYEMWLRWMHAGVRFAKVPEVLFTWNDLPSRLTRNHEHYSAEAFERAKTHYLKLFVTKNNPSSRKIYLCGAGRITRKKSVFLRTADLRVDGYIDVDPKKIGKTHDGIPVIGLNDLPGKQECYVISYVSNRGARDEIRNALLEKEFAEGCDFVMAG